MKCVNCGNEVQDGVVTCPFCNANLNNQVPVTPTTPVLPQDQNIVVTPEAPVVEDYFAQQAGGDEMDIDLTDEDRTYLRLKWGKAYKPEEWVKLE